LRAAVAGGLALGEQRAHVVGHDWGAATTYVLAAAFPERVARVVTLAIPHPFALAPYLTSAPTAHRLFHFWFFQLPGLPEAAIPRDDFAFIDYLFHLWAPGFDDPEHVARVKAMLAHPGAVASTIAYYRAMFRPENQDPRTAPVRSAVAKPITPPTMALFGSRDITPTESAAGMKPFFAGDLRTEILDGCGHFLHRERPADVSRLVLDWLAAG
jgi:pimeloyl-ACP methyl ester carboxylesterase